MEVLHHCTGFDCDAEKNDKIWTKYDVIPSECEQIFFNHPLMIHGDEQHSQTKKRFYALGKTDLKRPLFIVFTLRGHLIRVISARDMSRKEKEIYDDAQADTKIPK